jgi:hypothetical protein
LQERGGKEIEIAGGGEGKRGEREGKKEKRERERG